MLPLRTFIAVNVAPPVEARIGKLINALRNSRARVKWVGERNLHITLQFLGDVPPQRIPEVCEAIKRAVREVDPFEFNCRGLGAFPDLERPRTLWIGVDRGGREMQDLQARIERCMAELGFRPEARSFQPHLTVGRVKRSHPEDIADMIEGRQDVNAGATLVSEVTVYASELGREGPTYTVLARLPLGVE